MTKFVVSALWRPSTPWTGCLVESLCERWMHRAMGEGVPPWAPRTSETAKPA